MRAAILAGALVLLMVGVAYAASPADYDVDGDGTIDRDEALAAISDYLFDGTLSYDEVIGIIRHYLFGDPVVHPESDARLSGLELENLSISPAFKPATESYTATVPDPSKPTSIAATPANSGATVVITIEGNAATEESVSLDEGTSVIEIKVTSTDETVTQVYRITITWALATPTLTPTPTPLPYSTALSQEGFDCFFDREASLGKPGSTVAGCSGFHTDTIYKWGKDSLTVYIDPSGTARTKRIAREVMDYLEPILGLDFTYTTTLNDQTDVAIAAGVERHEDWEDIVGEGCLDEDTLGCASVDTNYETSTLFGALLVIWADALRDDLAMRATILHEAIHALTGVKHSDNLRSIVWPTAFLDLPNMLPYEEDVYRLWGQDFVEPGMRASELRPQIENTPPERTLTDQETALDAYMQLITHDRIDFDVALTFPEQRCAHHNTTGSVMLTSGGNYPYWHIGDLPRVIIGRGAIDLLLISLARQEKALASGSTNQVRFIPPQGSWYSGYTVTYTVTLDDAGRVSGFTMNWSYTTTNSTSCARYNVTASNFRYSAGVVPLSIDPEAEPLPPTGDGWFTRGEEIEPEPLPRDTGQ